MRSEWLESEQLPTAATKNSMHTTTVVLSVNETPQLAASENLMRRK